MTGKLIITYSNTSVQDVVGNVSEERMLEVINDASHSGEWLFLGATDGSRLLSRKSSIVSIAWISHQPTSKGESQ